MPFCRRRFSAACRSKRTRKNLTRTSGRMPYPGRTSRTALTGCRKHRPSRVRAAAQRFPRILRGGISAPCAAGRLITMSKASRISRATRIRGCRLPRHGGTFIRSVRSHRGRQWRIEDGEWRMNSIGEHSPFFLFREINSLSPSEPSNRDQSVIFHSPFSILFCSAVLCCNIYSFLFFSALVCSTVLFSALLYSSVLFSALWIFRTINPVHCVLSRQEIAISRQEIRNAGRTHRIPPITNS